ETRNFAAHPALRAVVRGLVRSAAPLVRASGLDHQVQINNWLLSTNPVPGLDRTAAAELRDRLTRDHPDRALVIRSLNETADREAIAALRATGFRMLPARMVYIFSADDAGPRPSPDMRRDLRALARTPLRIVDNADFTAADHTRSAELYDMLYLRKYTPLNPRYTALYLRQMHEAGLMRFWGLRDGTDGRLAAMTALFENGRTLTQPVVGYDTTRPQREGLYRMVMAMAQDHARREGLFFNMSAGAAAFKRHRQARPVIEYSAVFCGHLPKGQRSAIRAMEAILTRIGIPLLQRFEL
ncbi:MAG: GNAT family N-acetyltransferase, partial [Pseudorhodobacter sp.]